MKNLKLLILLITVTFYNCERDDICAEGTSTTPQLLIEFFDITEIETLKSVTRLSVYGEKLFLNATNELVPPTVGSSAVIAFNVNVNNVKLPLLIGENEGEITTTRYALEQQTNLRLNENAATNSNIDILEITYKPEFVYVSRACGFKSVFNELTVRVIPDDNVWIQSFNYINASGDITNTSITVENENQTHVQLFH